MLFRPSLTYPRIPYGEMLTRPVGLYPEREAIRCQDVSLTFRELEGLVNAFAHGLQRLGIGRGDRVCLFMTNRPEYVVAFLALARLGAVASPMNPSYREREVAYQLADAEAVAVVVQPELLVLVRAVRAQVPKLQHVITTGPPGSADADTHAFGDLLPAGMAGPPSVGDIGPDELLVLAFVVRRDPALTGEALLAWARGRLAGYKTLREVEFVDSIPKTASGKILRRVLREQDRRRLGLA